MTKKQLIKLMAMEEYLYQSNLGEHEIVAGGWCIDECTKCERLKKALKNWEIAREK